jgi:hypothetical protein
MDKNQTLARPPERSTVEPGKAAPVGQRPMAQQPGKAETHVPPPQQQGKAETHGAPEKNA